MESGTAPQIAFLRAGHPAQVLLERAAVPDTSLLVIGAHRRRGLLDLRSTAHLLMSRAECPVWVQEGPVREVRRGQREAKPQAGQPEEFPE